MYYYVHINILVKFEIAKFTCDPYYYSHFLQPTHIFQELEQERVLIFAAMAEELIVKELALPRTYQLSIVLYIFNYCNFFKKHYNTCVE